jgi:hypothetical protein
VWKAGTSTSIIIAYTTVYYYIQVLQLICTRHKLLGWNAERRSSVQCICPFSARSIPRPSICFYFVPFLLSRDAKESYTYLLLDHVLVSVCQVLSFGSSICMLSPGMHIPVAQQLFHTVDHSTADIETSVAHFDAGHPLCAFGCHS